MLDFIQKYVHPKTVGTHVPGDDEIDVMLDAFFAMRFGRMHPDNRSHSGKGEFFINERRRFGTSGNIKSSNPSGAIRLSSCKYYWACLASHRFLILRYFFEYFDNITNGFC